jgi:hypothetical protein
MDRGGSASVSHGAQAPPDRVPVDAVSVKTERATGDEREMGQIVDSRDFQRAKVREKSLGVSPREGTIDTGKQKPTELVSARRRSSEG